MPTKKLPAYFEEYLNEKFAHVVYKIGEVKQDVKAIKDQLIILNGTTMNHKVKISLIGSRIRLLWIAVAVFAILLGVQLASMEGGLARVISLFSSF